jgi:hypothetical protein
MLSESRNVGGQRVSVSWVWGGTGERPAFRLVRGGAHLVGRGEDEIVFDSRGLFRDTLDPWERVSLVGFFAPGGSDRVRGAQATLALFHDVPGASPPVRVELRVADGVGGDLLVHTTVEDVTRVVHRLPDPGPWRLSDELVIYCAAPGRPERMAGVFGMLQDHPDRVIPSLLRWTPVDGQPLEMAYGAAELAQTRTEVRAVASREWSAAWRRVARLDPWDLGSALSDPEDLDPAQLAEVGAVTLREELSADATSWTRSVRITDARAPVHATSYALLVADGSGAGRWIVEREWNLSPTAAGVPFVATSARGASSDLPPARSAEEERTRDPERRRVELVPVVLDHLGSEVDGRRVRYHPDRLLGDPLREGTGSDPHLLSPN